MIGIETGKVGWTQIVKNLLCWNVEFELYPTDVREPLEVFKSRANMNKFVLLGYKRKRLRSGRP